MSEPQGAPAPTTETSTAPAQGAAPPAAPAAPPAAPQNGAASPPGDDPSWLAPRLERAKAAERAALLAELGVTDPEAAKTAIAEAAKAAEANKSAEQRAAETAAQLAAEKQERERLFAATRSYADHVLQGLDEAKRTAITQIAGDDPAKQLAAYNALSATWGAAPAAAPATTPPANTAPPPNAPPPAGSTSPTDKRAVYEQLSAKNPILAARYGLENPEVFEPKNP